MPCHSSGQPSNGKLALNGLRGSIAESAPPSRQRLRPEGHSPVSGTPQEPAIGAVVVRAPWLETSLLVELIRKVDVGPAVQQIPQVQSGPRQVHRVDLEIAPIQGAVGVVVIDFAGSLWILGALDCEGNPAGRRICCRRTAGRPLGDQQEGGTARQEGAATRPAAAY